MPVKRPEFANDEIYHAILRGIAGQDVFLEENDYLRCLFNLFKFNDEKPIIREFSYREVIPVILVDGFPKIHPVELERLGRRSRDLLVDILAVCLMPDHIHLLIRQLVENGISLFFQKMGGYSSYFNKKYQRFGSLFQRPFRAIHIKTDDQLLIVVTYIHLNPIDLVEPNWKIEGISDSQKVMEFLESYPWSSYSYYLGKNDLSWLTNSEFLQKILTNPEDFRNFVKARVFHKAELKSFLEKAQEFFLE